MRFDVDEHSGGDQNIELWSYTAKESGYTALRLFANIVESYRHEPTLNPLWQTLRAVRNDLIVTAAAGTKVWEDKRSGAHGEGAWQCVSLWSVVASAVGNGITMPVFAAAKGYDDPPASLSLPAVE